MSSLAEVEIWKDIPEYEGIYLASNNGRIKSIKSKNEKILKGSTDNRGYRIVSLWKDGKCSWFQVHKLIVITFLEYKELSYKIVIDHINNKKNDNRLENLQIISQRENASKDKDKNKTSSKYIGVYFIKKEKKWKVQIHINGKRKYLGRYKCEHDAGNAYKSELNKINK